MSAESAAYKTNMYELTHIFILVSKSKDIKKTLWFDYYT